MLSKEILAIHKACTVMREHRKSKAPSQKSKAGKPVFLSKTNLQVGNISCSKQLFCADFMSYLLNNPNECVQKFTSVHFAQDLKPNQNPPVPQSYNRVLVLHT